MVGRPWSESTPVMSPITVGYRKKSSTSNEIDPMSMWNNNGRFKREWLIMGIGCVAVVYFILQAMSASSLQSLSAGSSVYSVMIDAGSTGSRIHAYHFIRNEEGLPVLQSELFEQLKPGLSSYKDDPHAAAESLVPLLDAAVKKVPSQYRSSTPILVKATAGLRMTGKEQAEAILEAVREKIATYPFKFNAATGVEIMGGLSEAEFAWVTVNYLQNMLSEPSQKTAVMLDLGGGSTQIAMAIASSKGNVAKSQDYKTTSLLNQHHLLYLHSFLGQGLMAGRGGIFRDGGGAAAACIPGSETVSYKYNEQKWEIRGEKTDSSEACMAVARKALRQEGSDFSGSTETLHAGQPVFAMSYYFDRGVDAGLIDPGAEDGELTPGDYINAAKEACTLNSESEIKSRFSNGDPEDAKFLCTDLCFISTLLKDGFGLQDSTRIKLAKAIKFNGARVETQWTLGAAIAEIA